MSLNYSALALMAAALTAPLALIGMEPEILIGTEPVPAISASKTQRTAPADELKAIDSELNELTTQLSSFRKKALNAEMQAQPLMIDNWHEYAQDVRSSEENEKQVLIIKNRINVLVERKKNILDSTSTH